VLAVAAAITTAFVALPVLGVLVRTCTSTAVMAGRELKLGSLGRYCGDSGA
jgi:hypothetical protein